MTSNYNPYTYVT